MRARATFIPGTTGHGPGKRLRVAIAHEQTATQMGQGNADASVLRGLSQIAGELDIVDLRLAERRAAVSDARRLPIGRLAQAPWSVQSVAGEVLYRNADLVHRLDLRLPPFGGREIVTVYDVAPLRFGDEGQMPRSAARSIQRADAIICPSRFSATEISDCYGRDDAHVIPPAVDPSLFTVTKPTRTDLYDVGLSGRWVLHSGGATLRKNLARLAAAWPEVRRHHPDVVLALCGPEDARRTQLFNGLPGTRILGRLPRDLQMRLMAGASAVVVPSIYEGYGFPVQEAMAVGVPVVAMRAAALPEVAGPGAVLVEDDTDSLTQGLIRALDGVEPAVLQADQDLARERTEALTAGRHLEVYRGVRSAGRA
jgi:glycosyltransferase involved in cell wall biosynthesis